MAKEKLTWFDSKGQEYYFDYPIGMKEKDIKIIEELSLEQLHALNELLYLEEYDGKDVTEAREKVWDTINSKSPYAGATDEELGNLHFRMGRLVNEGQDFLGPMQTIENELIRRDEKKIDKEIQPRSESGIIFEE